MNIELIDETLLDLQFQQEALDLAKRKAKWNASRSIVGPIASALVKLNIEPTIDSSSDFCIYCTGDKQMLVKIMRILMTSGYRTDEKKPEAGKSGWTAYFQHTQCPMRIYLSFTSSVCRLVQTGTKIVEMPVYETRCEELPCETALISVTESTPALVDDIPF